MSGSKDKGPLLTAAVLRALRKASAAGAVQARCSLDLERSQSLVDLGTDTWAWNGLRFPYPDRLKDRTIYHWTGGAFEPVSRFGASLIKLVPTEWGAPTFEIDGIKMLPTARVSPYADAQRKVGLIAPAGKVVFDTCGGLGYFAAWCLHGGAQRILSFEKNADVIWLRSLNPWSPEASGALTLFEDDVTLRIAGQASGSIDAILHDPPRFGIAGELYSQAIYHEFARVLKRKGRLFHYTGSPNRLTSGRDVAQEVTVRLRQAGFSTETIGDGVLATRT